MQTICTSLQTDNHISTPSLNVYRPDALPDSVKALNAECFVTENDWEVRRSVTVWVSVLADCTPRSIGRRKIPLLHTGLAALLITPVVCQTFSTDAVNFIDVQYAWYGDSVDNTVEKNSSVFSLIWMRQQGHVNSETLHQQNAPVLNWRCWLTQVDLYNGRKMSGCCCFVQCTCSNF